MFGNKCKGLLHACISCMYFETVSIIYKYSCKQFALLFILKQAFAKIITRLAFFLQKRPVRCLLYNKFFNFHSSCKIFRICIEHIIPQNLMFFVFEIVTFLAGKLCGNFGAKKLYNRYRWSSVTI